MHLTRLTALCASPELRSGAHVGDTPPDTRMVLPTQGLPGATKSGLSDLLPSFEPRQHEEDQRT